MAHRLSSSVLVLLGPLTVVQAQSAAPSGPSVSITPGSRHAHVTPGRQGFTHTGGGNVDVAQPSPDVVLVTMTGVAVAGAHPCKDSAASLQFDLDGYVEIKMDDPKRKSARLSLEARVIGLLRSHDKGMAEEGPACATVSRDGVPILTTCAPGHSVCRGENLSVNCQEGPVTVPVTCGTYVLHETFVVRATHPHSLLPCKAASAEFGPDPALDPLWISYWEPFHGAVKKDFGFRVIVKVLPE